MIIIELIGSILLLITIVSGLILLISYIKNKQFNNKSSKEIQ